MNLRRGELPEHVRRDLQAAAALPNKFHRLGEINRIIALAKETYGKKNVIVRLLEMVKLVLEKPAVTQPVGRKRRKEKFRGTACYI